MENLNEDLTRQLDLIPIKVLNTPITIIGAGAIGSFTAFALAKMGFGNLEVWDNDKVDIENMCCSLYSKKDVGHSKVTSLYNILMEFSGTPISYHKKFYEAGQFPGIVIMAVDSMQARKLIFDNHAKGAPHTKALIDCRMGAEHITMFTIDPNNKDDLKTYERSWFPDSKGVHEPCTAKATIYTANLIAGFACKVVKDLVTDNPYTRVLQYSVKDNAIEIHNKRTK